MFILINYQRGIGNEIVTSNFKDVSEYLMKAFELYDSYEIFLRWFDNFIDILKITDGECLSIRDEVRNSFRSELALTIDF